MIAVVCDSNVYISAIVFGGQPREVVACGERGAFQLLVSSAVIAEVETILDRKFGWEPQRLIRIVNPIWRATRLVEVRLVIRECRDPKDNHLLALALEAGAEFIVTGDRDLLVLHPFRGVQILCPAAFLAAGPWK